MRAFTAGLVFFLGGCGPGAEADDPCGLGLELPGIDVGTGRYLRDGAEVQGTGGYRLAFPHDIVLNTMTVNMRMDGEGREVEELVAAGALRSGPICVVLDGSADGAGYVLLEDGSRSFSTSDVHTGMLALLDLDDDVLSGRFEFTVVENGGSGTSEVTAGLFRLRPR